MIPVEEARRLVLSRCPPLSPRAVPLDDALGCVTSVAVSALDPVPGASRSRYGPSIARTTAPSVDATSVDRWRLSVRG